MATNETLTAPASTRGRALTITLWVLQILLAVFFLVGAAVPKLTGDPTQVEMFDHLGGQWFRYVVGTLEAAGAIGLLIPRLAGLAALGLFGVMVGATFASVFVLGAGVLFALPAALGVVAFLVAWGRWPQTKALLASLRR